jgi:hypothetical protein
MARYMPTYISVCARPSSNAIQTGYAASLVCLVLLHLDKQLMLMFNTYRRYDIIVVHSR